VSDFGPDEWAERERLDHLAQQDDEERMAKERELRERMAVLEARVESTEKRAYEAERDRYRWRARAEQAETTLEAAEDLADRQCQDHRAELAEAEEQIRAADASITKARALAANATRTGCGAGWDLDPSDVLAALDQPAVEVQ
jgi:hypothetical protein